MIPNFSVTLRLIHEVSAVWTWFKNSKVGGKGESLKASHPVWGSAPAGALPTCAVFVSWMDWRVFGRIRSDNGFALFLGAFCRGYYCTCVGNLIAFRLATGPKLYICAIRNHVDQKLTIRHFNLKCMQTNICFDFQLLDLNQDSQLWIGGTFRHIWH